MRAGYGLLRLHDFHGIGDAGSEPVAGLRQSLLGEIDVASSDCDLLFAGFDVQQRSANVGVDLCAQALEFVPALFQARVGLEDIAMYVAALKDRNSQSAA